MSMCRHCQKYEGQEDYRGLCRRCYMTPDVRALYPGSRVVRRRNPPANQCRHCLRANVKRRRRGLCWICYHKPGVREQYPSTSKFAPHSRRIQCQEGMVPDFTGPGTDPSPVPYLPGTAEKIAAMEERVAAGQRVFCRGDGRRETA